ncbi:MAG: HEAT repeat domain-containing protein [Polyangiaceae bacterium]
MHHPIAERLSGDLAKALESAKLEQLPDIVTPIYKQDPSREPAPPRAPVNSLYVGSSELLKKTKAGEPQAIEAALITLAGESPAKAQPFAQTAIHEGWPHLRATAARVLGRCASKDSFQALLTALEEVNPAGLELRNNGYPEGAAFVMEEIQRHPALTSIPTEAGQGYTGQQRMAAQALLAFFGREPDDPALASRSIDLLRKVYVAHPDRHIRMAAGHALCERGDRDSLEVLISQENATDAWGRWFAARALIELDPSTAYQRLKPRLKEPDFRTQVIKLLLQQSQAALKADPERGWVPEDSGFIEWLEGLKKDRQLGQSAQGILAAYKGGGPSPEPKRTLKPSLASKGAVDPELTEAVASYLATPNAAAWKALTKLSGSKPLAADAIPVLEPAVLRLLEIVAGNLQQIHAALKDAGYRFIAKRPLEPPKRSVGKDLKRLETAVGPLPLVLNHWLRKIGVVDFRGQLDAWGASHTDLSSKQSSSDILLTDPLVVSSLSEALDELDTWNEAQPFEFPVGPDAEGKAGFSGGEVRLLVSGATLDAPLTHTPKAQSFTDFLRHSLKYAGFPGLAKQAKRDPVLGKLMSEFKPF